MTSASAAVDAPPSTPRARSVAGRRLLFVVNNPAFFVSHRLGLGIAARDAGYDVHVATPRGAAVDQIVAERLAFHEVEMTRSGGEPWLEARTIRDLYRLYVDVAPAIVHHVTIKPILYGNIAARLAKVPAVVNAVSGLGYVFLANGVRASLVRAAVTRGYRTAFAQGNSRTIFQNRDDRALFVDEKHWARSLIVPGSGVDMQLFVSTPEPAGVPVVVMPSRLLWDKGVREFVDAASDLRRRGVRARFVLVGETDAGNPAGVPQRTLDAWQREGIVEWWGFRSDMATVLGGAHVVCLPSYREGLPKVLVEAAACGRAIVTTDAPGCREIVRHEDNGLLVPVRDAKSLAEALGVLITDDAKRRRMGARGREIAEHGFSLERVVDATLALYDELLARAPLT